jgi:hypothetical protein
VTQREGESDEPRLPEEVKHFYSLLAMDAGSAAFNLYEAWERPVRHNKKIERLALWHTVRLDEECERASSDMRLLPHLTFSPSNAMLETRYDIQAAIATVPQLVPFTGSERNRLRVPTQKTFEDWGEDMSARESELVDRWHVWLWLENSRTRDPDADRGNASALALAARGLADGLRSVLRGNPEPS